MMEISSGNPMFWKIASLHKLFWFANCSLLCHWHCDTIPNNFPRKCCHTCVHVRCECDTDIASNNQICNDSAFATASESSCKLCQCPLAKILIEQTVEPAWLYYSAIQGDRWWSLNFLLTCDKQIKRKGWWWEWVCTTANFRSWGQSIIKLYLVDHPHESAHCRSVEALCFNDSDRPYQLRITHAGLAADEMAKTDPQPAFYDHDKRR